jgi:hypothetical protein
MWPPREEVRMARQVFTIEEITAMLKATSAPNRVIEKFCEQAGFVATHKQEWERTTGEEDHVDRITVSSSFGQKTQRGLVEFTLNAQRTQMDVRKAREIGLMLIECAEAATSDEMFVTFVRQKFDVNDPQAIGMLLLDLREIRQGTREIAWPAF